MLEDRDYMRQPAYDDGPPFARLLNPRNWSWTVIVLVINVAVFLIECAVSSQPLAFVPDNLFFDNYLALSREGLTHGFAWQLLTYQFMHASFWHLFFNCWALYVFGRFLEPLIGARNLLLVLFSSGVVGGLVQVLSGYLGYFWPQLFIDGPVVGASAGVFGLVAAFATLFPERELTMLLFFIIPVRMRAKTLLLGSAILALAGIFFPALFNHILGGNVANAAHLGGMLAGMLYVRLIILGRWSRSQVFSNPWQPDYPAAPTPKPAPLWRPKPARPDVELSADELLKTQVDPILDKISAHGLHSLTAREREILERASGKLAKR